MCIKTHLDNTLYLSSLWSDLSCTAELVIAGAPAGYNICSIYFPSLFIPSISDKTPLGAGLKELRSCERKEMLSQRKQPKKSSLGLVVVLPLLIAGTSLSFGMGLIILSQTSIMEESNSNRD